MSKSVLNFIRATKETIVVTTPDPTSITDAYALIKTIKEGVTELPDIKLLVNRIDDPNEGAEIYEKLSSVCERFLGIKLSNLGSIPYDKLLGRSVKKQSPVSILYPEAESAKSIEAVCRKLLDIPPLESKVSIRSFISKLLNRRG
jgi:flagellar biosynthesis protein FlhG